MVNAVAVQEAATTIRVRILQMINKAPKSHPGHPGGALSAADIVAALYFGGIMNVDPKSPKWEGRDRFVLSKGHAAPVVYAALAERGFFPREELLTLRRVGSRLQGHPDMRKTPGLDMTTGSLGQGLSTAVGMALGGQIRGAGFHTFALLSDGELDEGQTWEAAMTAAKYRLSKLTAIVDCNGIQNDGFVQDVMPLGDLAAKWRSFGWQVTEVDGHDPAALLAALTQAKAQADGPGVVLAKTVKGKGISFMENVPEWHAKPVTDQDLKAGLAELGWTGGDL